MMNQERLDLSPLTNALQQLEKAYSFSVSELASSNIELFEQFRNSTIQCFEFTFELSVNFIKRKLEFGQSVPQTIDTLDYKDVIREAATAGLVKNPQKWFDFRKYRNLSSHAYDKTKADLVYSAAKDLIVEVTFLLSKLK